MKNNLLLLLVGLIILFIFRSNTPNIPPVEKNYGLGYHVGVYDSGGVIDRKKAGTGVCTWAGYTDCYISTYSAHGLTARAKIAANMTILADSVRIDWIAESSDDEWYYWLSPAERHITECNEAGCHDAFLNNLGSYRGSRTFSKQELISNKGGDGKVYINLASFDEDEDTEYYIWAYVELYYYIEPDSIWPTCTDECSVFGEFVCAGNGYKQCGEFDADDCHEYSIIIPCPAGKTCSDGVCVTSSTTCVDSDNGNTPSVLGTVSGSVNGVAFSKTDECISSNGAVREYYCEGNTWKEWVYICPCTSGTCKFCQIMGVTKEYYDGPAVPNAQITFDNNQGSQFFATSNSAGIYTIQLPFTGSYTQYSSTAVASGYTTATGYSAVGISCPHYLNFFMPKISTSCTIPGDTTPACDGIRVSELGVLSQNWITTGGPEGTPLTNLGLASADWLSHGGPQ